MPLIKKIFLIVLVGMLSACVAVPTGNTPETNLRRVKDGLGREVTMPEKVDRAVSLAPSITEMVFAAGAGEKLVGVTSYCNYPPEAAAKPKVGDTQTPNVEAIIALRPQVVFVSTDSQLQTFADVLAEQNVAVFVLNIKRFDDVPVLLRLLGDLFGTARAAESAASDLQRRSLAVSEKQRGEGTVRTFVQISNEPLFTIGRDSFVTEIVERAGGASVTRDVATGYPKLNKETAFALKPDAIILSDSEDNREPNVAFKDSPAVKNGRVYRLNADIISRPGPRLVDAMEQIEEFLHGVEQQTE